MVEEANTQEPYLKLEMFVLYLRPGLDWYWEEDWLNILSEACPSYHRVIPTTPMVNEPDDSWSPPHAPYQQMVRQSFRPTMLTGGRPYESNFGICHILKLGPLRHAHEATYGTTVYQMIPAMCSGWVKKLQQIYCPNAEDI
jgi:hypothetical protein